MSYENRLSDDQINALKPGDTVLIERWTHPAPVRLLPSDLESMR